jgi:predicted dehydrogenase
MRDTLRIALLGCGRIARLVHIDILRRLPGVQLVAAADADESNLAEIASRVSGIRTFADFGAAIAESNADAAVVALPSALHAPAAIQVLAAGKHVYLEKPLGISAEQAFALLDAWRAAKCTAVIGFNYRFHPLLIELGRAIRDGDLGEIIAVRSAFAVAPRVQPAWRAAREHGGGALLELGSHHLDLVHVLFDSDVAQVSATVRSLRSGADTAAVQCHLESGVSIQSFFSTAAPGQDRWEVIGARARLDVDREAGTATLTRTSGPASKLESLRARFATATGAFRGLISPVVDPSHERALSAFADAARGGSMTSADPLDGWRSLCLVLAAETSAAEGRGVDPRTQPQYSRRIPTS